MTLGEMVGMCIFPDADYDVEVYDEGEDDAILFKGMMCDIPEEYLDEELSGWQYDIMTHTIGFAIYY